MEVHRVISLLGCVTWAIYLYQKFLEGREPFMNSTLLYSLTGVYIIVTIILLRVIYKSVDNKKK